MASRVGLSKSSVVEAAAGIADAQGLDALSLAAVAEQLKVRTPTLYHYVAGLPGLRREVALLSLREQAGILGKSVMGRAGNDALRAMANAFRAYILARPGRYVATVRSAQDTQDAELQAAQGAVVDVVVRALSAYALSPSDTVHMVRMLRAAIHGFATMEAAGGFGLPEEVDETFRRLLGALLATVERESDGGAG